MDTAGDAQIDPATQALLQRQEALASDIDALRKGFERLIESRPGRPTPPPGLRSREIYAFRKRALQSDRGRYVPLALPIAAVVISVAVTIGIVFLADGGSSVVPVEAVATAPPISAASVPVADDAGARSVAADVVIDPRVSPPSSESLTTTTADSAIAPSGGSGINITSVRVQPGDTVEHLAIQYGTTIEAIVNLNSLADPNLIVSGSFLDIAPGYHLPRADAGPDS